MGLRIVFVERRDAESSSLERVFSVIGNVLSGWGMNINFVKLPYGNAFKGMIANLFAPKLPQADIYHLTGHVHYYALLLPVKKTVLTIHDLQVLRVRKGLRRYFVKKIFYELPVKRLRYITAISEQTKRELVELIGCSDDKIAVIENPRTIEPELHKRPFNRDRPVILHISTAPHKNLPNLIRAISRIKLDCCLKIIGKLDDATQRMLDENRICYESRHGLSDHDMVNEYRNADIVSFCSLAEGFGLPIIEAQALGVPVITSNISPMKEVAGEGALLVDPNNPDCIAAGIAEIINNEALRMKIVGTGSENVRRFSPEHVAGQYWKLYMEIAADNSQHAA